MKKESNANALDSFFHITLLILGQRIFLVGKLSFKRIA